jgi:uncharacterized membrane protein
LLGLSRRSKAGVAIAASGGLLALVGAKAVSRQRRFAAGSSMLVNCAPDEAYRFWRKLENLPLFMRHLESVTITGDRTSRWIAVGPLGVRVRWDAEIVAERPNELLAWHSLEGSDLLVDGSVEFRSAPANRGTLITATIIYEPPVGPIGRAVAKIFGKDPGFLMRQDLRRLKALIETGEIPTTEGQTHGPRSGVTAVARVLDPDQAVHSESRIVEVISAKRRVS